MSKQILIDFQEYYEDLDRGRGYLYGVNDNEDN